MHDETKYLVLDGTVYVTQYTVLALMAKTLLKIAENESLMLVTEEDKKNALELQGLLELVYENKTAKRRDTLFNLILTREEYDYITLTEDFVKWLLHYYDDLNELDSRTSAIVNLIGTKDVILVYNEYNMIEMLLLKKMGLLDKVKSSNIISIDEMCIKLDLAKDKYQEQNKRPSILTDNKYIIDEYVKDFPILAPATARWISRDVVGIVNIWAPEDKINKENENESREN